MITAPRSALFMSEPTTLPLPPLRRTLRIVLRLLVVALVLEAGARLVLAPDLLFRRLASPYDEPSWRLSWLHRHDDPASPFRFSFDRHHPIRGWTLAPDLREVEVFSGKRLSSNSRGMRGRREVAVPKPEGITRIALLGDSFAFGEEVGDEETFARGIERIDPAIEVLNLGVHGYGHDQMLLTLREELPLDHPDVVLLAYVTDDSLRNLLTFRDYAKPRFHLRDGRLELAGTPVPAPAELLARERWRSRFVDLFTMARERVAWRWGDRAAEVDRLTDALLTAIFRETRAAGARPAVALLPAFSELGATDEAPLPAEAFVMRLAAREGVPAVRLRPAFLERARLGAEFERVGHWGPSEHRVAAGAIVDFLRRERLVASDRIPRSTAIPGVRP